MDCRAKTSALCLVRVAPLSGFGLGILVVTLRCRRGKDTMAAPIQGLRVRVERLLRGNFRAEDLNRLFLYARDRCQGRESVQEIGDFVAHHDERSKGVVTRRTRDFFFALALERSTAARRSMPAICRPNIPTFSKPL
jgi:hypothetical protein